MEAQQYVTSEYPPLDGGLDYTQLISQFMTGMMMPMMMMVMMMSMIRPMASSMACSRYMPYARKTIYTLKVPKDPLARPTLDRVDQAMQELGYSGFTWLDMLRYDNGKITKVEADGFIVEAPAFTEGRWRSFGVRPTLISTRTVSTEKEFQRFMDDNREWFAKLTLRINEKAGWTGSEYRVNDAEWALRDIENKRKSKSYWR